MYGRQAAAGQMVSQSLPRMVLHAFALHMGGGEGGGGGLGGGGGEGGGGVPKLPAGGEEVEGGVGRGGGGGDGATQSIHATPIIQPDETELGQRAGWTT